MCRTALDGAASSCPIGDAVIGDGDDEPGVLGGVASGIRRADVPRILGNILADHDATLELWIRPAVTGYGYTVEWTTLDEELEHPVKRSPDNHFIRLKLTADTVQKWLCQVVNRLTSVFQGRMPSFDVNREQINLFVVDDLYLFKHYFEQNAVFGTLRRYYNEDAHRFEVPEDALAEVQEVPRDHFYDPVIVEEPESFCVVHRRYTDHPDVLFKASVLQRSRDDYHIFLMKDQLSVDQAVNNRATPINDTDLDCPI